MMKLIGKKFMKSAACFSVLCALGAGMTMSNVMASAAEVSSPISEQGINNPFAETIPQSISGQNFIEKFDVNSLWVKGGSVGEDGKKKLEVESPEYVPVLAMDCGFRNIKVSQNKKVFDEMKAEDVIKAEILENTLSKRNIKNTLCFVGDGALAAVMGDQWQEAGVSRRQYIEVLCNTQKALTPVAFGDDGLQYFLKVSKRGGKVLYSPAPMDVPNYVSVLKNGAPDRYAIYDDGECKTYLSQGQYNKMQADVQARALLMAGSIVNQYGILEKFIVDAVRWRSEKGNVGRKPLISFTVSDSLQGYSLECCVKAIKCVFEAAAKLAKEIVGQNKYADDETKNVNNTGRTIWEYLKNVDERQEETAFDYRIVPQSLAAQAAHQYDNVAEKIRSLGDEKPGGKITPEGVRCENHKVVMVNYGYDGLSISAAEHHGDGFTMYPDRYFTNCGGRAIDDACVSLITEKVKELAIAKIREGIGNLDLDEDEKKKVLNQVIERELAEFEFGEKKAKILHAWMAAKEKLSAEGATAIEISIESVIPEGAPAKHDWGWGYKRGDCADYDFTYSVAELNKVLEDKKIRCHFEEAIENYIMDHKVELGLDKNGKGDFEISVVGGSLRIPLLYNTISKILEKHNQRQRASKTLNMDESCANGVDYLGFYFSTENITGYKCDADMFKNFGQFDDTVLQKMKRLFDYGLFKHNLDVVKNDYEAQMYDIQRALYAKIEESAGIKKVFDDMKTVLSSTGFDKDQIVNALKKLLDIPNQLKKEIGNDTEVLKQFYGALPEIISALGSITKYKGYIESLERLGKYFGNDNLKKDMEALLDKAVDDLKYQERVGLKNLKSNAVIEDINQKIKEVNDFINQETTLIIKGISDSVNSTKKEELISIVNQCSEKGFINRANDGVEAVCVQSGDTGSGLQNALTTGSTTEQIVGRILSLMKRRRFTSDIRDCTDCIDKERLDDLQSRFGGIGMDTDTCDSLMALFTDENLVKSLRWVLLRNYRLLALYELKKGVEDELAQVEKDARMEVRNEREEMERQKQLQEQETHNNSGLLYRSAVTLLDYTWNFVKAVVYAPWHIAGWIKGYWR